MLFSFFRNFDSGSCRVILSHRFLFVRLMYCSWHSEQVSAYIRFSDEHGKLLFSVKRCPCLKNSDSSMKLMPIPQLCVQNIYTDGFSVVVEHTGPVSGDFP